MRASYSAIDREVDRQLATTEQPPEQASKQPVSSDGSMTLREAQALRWSKPRESLATIIERLPVGTFGKGREALLALVATIATTARHERDQLKAAELLLAYSDGRPAQTILTADVTPQWAEHQIRQRYPHLSDEQVAALLAKLTTQGALPEPT